MRLSAKTIGPVTLQAALCFAPTFALMLTALQTDGRGVPETHVPLSANASPYYAAQFRFFAPNQANLSVRIAHQGAFSAAELNIKPSHFRVEIESANPESYDPNGAWFPGSAPVFRSDADKWGSDGTGPLGRCVVYGGRKYLIGVRRDGWASPPPAEKFEMILRVDEINQPQRMSAFGVVLAFGSVLSAGVGAALFRRNLRRRGIFR